MRSHYQFGLVKVHIIVLIILNSFSIRTEPLRVFVSMSEFLQTPEKYSWLISVVQLLCFTLVSR